MHARDERKRDCFGDQRKCDGQARQQFNAQTPDRKPVLRHPAQVCDLQIFGKGMKKRTRHGVGILV